MFRDFTWTEKHEEAMSDEQPLINDFINFIKAVSTIQFSI